MVVELVGPYPGHDDLDVGRNEKVGCGCVGTVALERLGQHPDQDLKVTAIGLGDEAARWVPLEPRSEPRKDTSASTYSAMVFLVAIIEDPNAFWSSFAWIQARLRGIDLLAFGSGIKQHCPLRKRFEKK